MAVSSREAQDVASSRLVSTSADPQASHFVLPSLMNAPYVDRVQAHFVSASQLLPHYYGFL
jgi:hypothetical protein